MSVKQRIANALASFGGQVTRYWINLNTFDHRRVPKGAECVAASYGGRKLEVTYRLKGGAL